MRGLFLPVWALALVAQAAIAVDDQAAWSADSRQEVYAVDGVDLLNLDQGVGDLRIEGAAVDSVIVTMVYQLHRDDPREPEVREERGESGLTLTFGFTQSELAEHDEWNKRRIDVGVQVPADLALSARTSQGRIEIKKLTAAVELATGKGAIEFDGSGALQARSVQGSIRALARSTQSEQPLSLQSSSGDLIVTLLEGASATVELATRGLMTSDYSIEIDRERGSRQKAGHVVVGAGRRPIRLVSDNGSIRLANVIVEEQPQDRP